MADPELTSLWGEADGKKREFLLLGSTECHRSFDIFSSDFEGSHRAMPNFTFVGPLTCVVNFSAGVIVSY